MQPKLSKLLLFFTKSEGRIWTIGVACMIAFGILIGRFYNLQIADYETYKEDLRTSTQREMTVVAERGEIYDRYGYPLAVNEATENIYYASNVSLDDETLNTLLLKLITLLEKNGDSFIDEVPITHQEPFTYTENTTLITQFTYNIPYDNEAHRKILCTYTAEEMMTYLQEVFHISEKLPPDVMRKLVALRSNIYSCKYRQYEAVLLAEGVCMETVSYLKEHDESLPNLTVEASEKRVYPLGSMASNILGYTRTITYEQYIALKDKGYSAREEVGQMGVEKTLQNRLRGLNGSSTIEVDNMGRKMRVLEDTPTQKGEDIYLTIDAKLQQSIYEILEKRLNEALVTKLNENKGLTGEMLLASLIKCHNIDFTKNLPYTQTLKSDLEAAYADIDPLMKDKVTLEALLEKRLNLADNTQLINHLLLVLQEQGVLKLDENLINQIKNGQKVDLTKIFMMQLRKNNLSAGQMAEDPFSAVAIMVDVQTGEVLSLVDYPSYDNNKMVTDFEHYFQTIYTDSRSLLWQRSLKTLKAPGSTFKMITALAGLQEGCITPQTVIDDVGIYKQAGKPYPKCWYYTSYGKGHGKLDLRGAIASSCNYYFYEVAHRLTTREGGENMSLLSKYMKLFGLTQKTGIELEEKAPLASTPDMVVTNKLEDLMVAIAAYDEVDLRKLSAIGKITLMQQLDLKELQQTSEAKNLYETAVQENLEPLLQEAFETVYEELFYKAYSDLRDFIKLHELEVKEDVVSSVLAQQDVTQREEKAKEVLYGLVEKAMTQELNAKIESVLSNINHNDFLDAYEKSLTTAYRQSIRQQGEDLESKTLLEQIKHLNRDEALYYEAVLLKVRQNLLNTIVNKLLDGVELNWTEGISVRTAIGQGYNAFSPLQVVRYIAALANGKEIRPLTLVKQTKVCEGSSLELSPEYIQAVQEGMLAVTVDDTGTAKGQFDNLPFKVAVKTGTAQEGSHEHSYIVAFVPYEKPEVALIVAIYNADGLGGYSTLMANDILLSYFGSQNKQESMTLRNTWME